MLTHRGPRDADTRAGTKDVIIAVPAQKDLV